jgi:hypothetical protein
MMVIGSASRAEAAATSLRWNSARLVFGQLTSLIHSATRCWPSGVSAYILRSERSPASTVFSTASRPAFSNRVSVT